MAFSVIGLANVVFPLGTAKNKWALQQQFF
jgi:hypothetical protein